MEWKGRAGISVFILQKIRFEMISDEGIFMHRKIYNFDMTVLI